LAGMFRLVILSNTDDELFALTRAHLDVDFDLVITAEQLRTYKPSSTNFAALVDRTGGRLETIVHVAESLFHDIAPAKAAGLRTVWVKRPKRFGAGATPAVDVEPDFAVADLHSLVEALAG
jgi:2-haloacid dehalogenase